ncbi:hypothetical protein [Thalassobellus sediminis]|uniref:hypothetical protein n=1 Tax=Thalassobellus sediminis TaxID=3367753 RepID=UPI00378F6D7F
MENRKYYLLNYIFIFGIVLLFFNDHFFKLQFSNWFTGKFSDFIGLLVFPFFLSFLFPKAIKWNVILTGVFFIFWKSPFSQDFIEFYNAITFIKITRVIDYTDYIALSILPIAYYFLKRIFIFDRLHFNKIVINPILLLLPTILVFMATSRPFYYDFYFSSKGNVRFFKNRINVKISQQDVLSEMGKMKVSVVPDSTFNTHNPKVFNFYSIDELILDKDTIKDLRFSMVSFKDSKTTIYLNAITISKEIKEDEVSKELRKYYKKILRKYIKENIKH